MGALKYNHWTTKKHSNGFDTMGQDKKIILKLDQLQQLYCWLLAKSFGCHTQSKWIAITKNNTIKLPLFTDDKYCPNTHCHIWLPLFARYSAEILYTVCDNKQREKEVDAANRPFLGWDTRDENSTGVLSNQIVHWDIIMIEMQLCWTFVKTITCKNRYVLPMFVSRWHSTFELCLWLLTMSKC